MTRTWLRQGALASVLLWSLSAAGQAQAEGNIELRPGGSSEVRYSFPKDPETLSVSRGGSLSMGLTVPTFPGYVTPNLNATYDSRRGDGAMGVGWAIEVPNLRLDFADDADALTSSPQDDVVMVGSQALLRGRWTGSGGPIVCDDLGSGSSTWTDLSCFNDPRGALRYDATPASSGDHVERWTAIDPHGGSIQHYGESLASRVVNDDGRPVTWLLARETNRWGKEVVHLYEERGTNERLRVAIQMAGNKVIKFNYTTRDSHTSPSEVVDTTYGMRVKREVRHLLTSIELLDNCVVSQTIYGDNDVDVNWTSGCASPTIVEKVELTYHNPNNRYTGRFALATWQHMSGDGSVGFRHVAFDYNGDGNPAAGDGTLTSNIFTEVTPEFEIPDGYTTAQGSAAAPFQGYYDWDADGLADWVSMKPPSMAGEYWPGQHDTGDIPEIYVRLRNDSKAFDSVKSYKDPFARYAAWMWHHTSMSDTDTEYVRVFDTLIDMASTAHSTKVPWVDVENTLTDPVEWAALATFSGGEPVIGIDVWPWIMKVHLDDENSPLVRSLSFSVSVEELDSNLHSDIVHSYLCAFEDDCTGSGWLDDDVDLTVKLKDFIDMDGDGYRDQVISGLLVTWDNNAPDVDANGFRDWDNMEPSVYVARFNPDLDDFEPYARYAIDVPTGDFANLGPAFLSALSVTRTFNTTPSNGDNAKVNGVQAASTAYGVSSTIWGLAMPFVEANSATYPPTASQLGVSTFLGLVDLAMMAGNLPPEAVSMWGNMKLAYRTVKFGVTLPSQVAKVKGLPTLKQAFEKGFSSTASQPFGWASLAGAGVGIAGAVANSIINAVAKKRMNTPGYNAMAVAHNARIATGTISVVTGSISLGLGIWGLIGASSLAAGPVGAVVLGAIGLGFAIYKLAGPDGKLELNAGNVNFNYKPQRGLVYTSGVADHESTHDTILDWTDLTGDGRPDLVVGRYDFATAAMAIAAADTTRGAVERTTRAWASWDFADTTVPDALSMSHTDTFFNGPGTGLFGDKDVHRADQSDVNVALIDVHGDGLADLVNVGETADSGYGFTVYPNTGTGFGAKVFFAADAASAPWSCTERPKISRGRSLSWQESVSNTEGYSIALSNAVQMLGPDLNKDGRPDLVVKLEDYASTGRAGSDSFPGGACVLGTPGGDTCDEPMPADTEPEKNTSKPCSTPQAKDVWYATFDGGFDVKDGNGEGASHLTLNAYDIHSPRRLGTHYVAFNTGEGFTDWIEIDGELPSLGGSVSIMSTIEHERWLPPMAVAGTTNFMADADAAGTARLIVLDSDDENIKLLSGTGAHPVYKSYRVGIANPDVLTNVTYPEGGEVSFDYSLKADVQGRQGPPMWVLDQATFDDKIRADFNAAEGWTGALPHVRYHYADAKRVGRDFRGFKSIAETRFSGSDVTQLIQVFEQDGPTAGSLVCSELRGRPVFDEEWAVQWTEHATCSETLRTSPLAPDQQVPSCAQDVLGELDLDTVHSLLKRGEYGYDDANSVQVVGDDGELYDVLKDFDMTLLTTSHFERGNVATWTQTDVGYNATPYKTPHTSTVTTSDGEHRAQTTEWTHHDADWAFVKAKETKHDGGLTDSVRIETAWGYDTAFPFALRTTTTTDPATGATRLVEHLSYDSGGLPTAIAVGGVTTHYTYVPDGVSGTGKIATITQPTDTFRTVAGVESTTYLPIGVVSQRIDAAGGVSSYTYDAFNIIEQDQLAGQGPRNYTYHNVGSPRFGRAASDITAGQRTRVARHIDGEWFVENMHWDGFYRQFRTSRQAWGAAAVDMDFDQDGIVDASHSLSDNDDWFAVRGAQFWGRDVRLNGLGEAQCTSLPYLDGNDPDAYAAEIRDPLRRPVLKTDFSDFGVASAYTIDASRGLTLATQVDDLGDTHQTWSDVLGRKLEVDRAGLTTETYEVGHWDELERVTDGAGGVTIFEHDAWGGVTKTCRLDTGSVPTSNVCPATGWVTETIAYDSRGDIIATTDGNGNTTTLTPSVCNATGETLLPSASSSDPTLTSTVTVSFDAACRPSQRIERDGSLTTFAYDAGGRLTSTTFATGLPEETSLTAGFDAAGRKRWDADGEGNTTYYLSDFRGNVLHTYEPEGSVTSAAFDVHGYLQSDVDATGFAISYERDLMGRETRRFWTAELCDAGSLLSSTFATLSDTVDVVSHYDGRGRLVARDAAGVSRTTFDYDALDRLVETCPPDPTLVLTEDCAAATTRTYDGAGRLLTETDALGRVRESVYDLLGRVSDRYLWHPAGIRALRTSLTYDANGNVLQTRLPNYYAALYGGASCSTGAAADHVIDATFSPLDQVETQTHAADASGSRHSEHFTYDAAGNNVSEVNAAGDVTTRVFDAMGRLVEETRPDLTVWTWDYDRTGQAVIATDGRGLPTTYAYDGQRRLVEVVPPTGYPTRIGYDEVGRETFRATLVDAGSNRWEAEALVFTADGKAAEMHTTEFFGGTPTYGALTLLNVDGRMCHEPQGQLAGAEDGNGNLTVQSYDHRARKISSSKNRSMAAARGRPRTTCTTASIG